MVVNSENKAISLNSENAVLFGGIQGFHPARVTYNFYVIGVGQTKWDNNVCSCISSTKQIDVKGNTLNRINHKLKAVVCC